jgi:cell division septation protein DedD
MPAPAAPERSESAEFEFVLGRRQVASLLFVATVILVIISAVSYLAGRSLPATEELPALLVAPAAGVPDPPLIPAVNAAITNAAEPATAPGGPSIASKDSGLPLFGDPVAGAVYIQMGAVERGIAIVFVEGLRKEGFDTFVAPGPNEKIFRVLIGPLPTPSSFEHAKQAVDRLGLNTFARKYQN